MSKLHIAGVQVVQGRSYTRIAERVLYLVAALCFLVLLRFQVSAHAARRVAQNLQPQSQAQPAPAADTKDSASSDSSQVIGRLDIPAITLSVPILSDFDASSLRKGVGYIQGTARPGGLGNMGLAGHRDTFFRPLRRIKPGLTINVVVPDGTYQYEVDRTEIVDPDKVQVLDIGDRPEMTLITCYPFEFVGAAPQRFIVHAHLLSAGVR